MTEETRLFLAFSASYFPTPGHPVVYYSLRNDTQSCSLTLEPVKEMKRCLYNVIKSTTEASDTVQRS